MPLHTLWVLLSLTDILTDPTWWVVIATFVAGVLVAAGSPLFLKWLERTRKQLSYKVISDTPLVQAISKKLIEVKIPPASPTPVTNANLLVLNIKNTGNVSVTDLDYNQEIKFTFPNREVLALTDVETAPKQGVVKEKDVDIAARDEIPGWVTLPKRDPHISIYTLNTKSAVRLTMLLSGSGNQIIQEGDLKGGEIKEDVPQKGFRKRYIFSGIGVLLILGSIIAGIFLNTPSSCVPGSISFGGSTALLPLVNDASGKYHAMCPQATITPKPSIIASEDGLFHLKAGNIDIADSDLRSSNVSFVDHTVAITIFVLVLNPSVAGVSNLTTKQIRGIYDGSITNWSMVGGPDMPIFVVSRASNSGTRKTFEQYVLNSPEKLKLGPRHPEVGTTETVATVVATTPGAIGYMDLGEAIGGGLQIVQIDGVEALQSEVINNNYRFWTVEHMYTKNSPSNLTTAFLNYILSDQFKGVISDLAYVPYNSVPLTLVNAHPSPLAPNGL